LTRRHTKSGDKIWGRGLACHADKTRQSHEDHGRAEENDEKKAAERAPVIAFRHQRAHRREVKGMIVAKSGSAQITIRIIGLNLLGGIKVGKKARRLLKERRKAFHA